MTTNTIKVFQVDDWAYLAARSAEDADAFITEGFERPEDHEDRELEEVTPTGNLLILLQRHIESGEECPAVIAIDNHYA